MTAWREYISRFKPEAAEDAATTTSTSRWRDEYEERAAIYEFEAGLPREEAEARAYENTLTAYMFQIPEPGTAAERRVAAIRALERAGICRGGTE